MDPPGRWTLYFGVSWNFWEKPRILEKYYGSVVGEVILCSDTKFFTLLRKSFSPTGAPSRMAFTSQLKWSLAWAQQVSAVIPRDIGWRTSRLALNSSCALRLYLISRKLWDFWVKL